MIDKKKRIAISKKQSDVKRQVKSMSMKLKCETVKKINEYCRSNNLTKQKFMELALAKLEQCHS